MFEVAWSKKWWTWFTLVQFVFSHPHQVYYIINNPHASCDLCKKGPIIIAGSRVRSRRWAGNIQWFLSTLSPRVNAFIIKIKLPDSWVTMQNGWVDCRLFWQWLARLNFLVLVSGTFTSLLNRSFGCEKVCDEDAERAATLKGFSLLGVEIAHWAETSPLYPTAVCNLPDVSLFGPGNDCLPPYLTFCNRGFKSVGNHINKY